MLRRVVLSSAAFRRVSPQMRGVSQTSVRFSEESANTADEAAAKKESESEAPVVELSETEKLQKEIEELSAKNKDMNDRLLRALADAENVRRISRIDVSNAREFAISKFAKALLDVSDNLKRAHESIDVDALEPKKQLDAIKVLHEGVVMTESQLQKVFREFKINQVGAVGDKFDPNVHDALFEYDDATKEAGSIGQLMKPGYLLNERVIRPAQVGVVKASKAQ
uniref:GrpE protein homolog n=1 Tax=Peronospora matthiolae TaxID=2874970 RepID=A0AAV1UIM0_9STRA